MINKLTLLALSIVLLGGGCISELTETLNNASNEDQSVTADVTLDDTAATVENESYDGPLTAHEYFMALPEEYLGSLAVADREDAIRTNDEDNYFLDFYPGDWEGNGSLAIFLHDDNRQILVVETKGCGPICEQEVFALEYVDGTWVDLTEEVLPQLTNLEDQQDALKEAWLAEGNTDPDNNFVTNVLYRIPQFGATITVYDAISSAILYELPWNGVTFDLEEVTVGDKYID